MELLASASRQFAPKVVDLYPLDPHFVLLNVVPCERA